MVLPSLRAGVIGRYSASFSGLPPQSIALHARGVLVLIDDLHCHETPGAVRELDRHRSGIEIDNVSRLGRTMPCCGGGASSRPWRNFPKPSSRATSRLPIAPVAPAKKIFMSTTPHGTFPAKTLVATISVRTSEQPASSDRFHQIVRRRT